MQIVKRSSVRKAYHIVVAMSLNRRPELGAGGLVADPSEKNNINMSA